jgi:preprotein translocase subunit YajC
MQSFLHPFPVTLAQADTAPPPAAEAPAIGEAAPLGSPATGAPAPGTPGGPAPSADPFGGGFMLLLLGMMVLLIVFSITSSRKEKKRKQEMINALSKGAKVQTVGGIRGTVVEVRDGEVIVKVDENNNTRLHLDKSAISAVMNDK